MKTQDFYNVLATKAGTTKAQAIALVRAFEAVLAEEVRDKGESITLNGVGKFALKDVQARMRRNPITGQNAEAKPYRTVQFHAAHAFRMYGETAKKGKK